MKLKPASRGFGEIAGRPRSGLRRLTSCVTDEATRLKATRVSLTRFGDSTNVSPAIAFWLRRVTVSPYPGTSDKLGPVKGSNRLRLPKLYRKVKSALWPIR